MLEFWSICILYFLSGGGSVVGLLCGMFICDKQFVSWGSSARTGLFPSNGLPLVAILRKYSFQSWVDFRIFCVTWSIWFLAKIIAPVVFVFGFLWVRLHNVLLIVFVFNLTVYPLYISFWARFSFICWVFLSELVQRYLMVSQFMTAFYWL